MPAPTIIDSLWFTVEDNKLAISAGRSLRTFRCASLLKPLYAWATHDLPPYVHSEETWRKLAKPSIVSSDNNATSEMWATCGAEAILSELQQKTRQQWQYVENYDTWGSLEIDASKVAKAYAELLHSNQQNSRTVLKWMSEVSDRQTFGAKQLSQDYLHVPSDAIAAKSGWFVDEKEYRLRSHVVLICKTSPHTYLGFVILTAKDVTAQLVHDYLARYHDGKEVLNIHTQLISDELRHELVRLLQAAKNRHKTSDAV